MLSDELIVPVCVENSLHYPIF